MQELEFLFGCSFPLDMVVDVRVHRARVSGIAAIALGDQPTTLTLGLSDGRRIEARSRGPGREQTSIEAVVRALAKSRATAALAAIGRGDAFAFGDVALRPDGILFEGKVTRWDAIAGYAIRDGGLLWDDLEGNLAGEVRLANIPFSDALCLAIAHKLPGKDYARMPPGEGPHGGVFAITARTRTPGTFKYQLHTFAALLLLPLLIYGGLRINRAWKLAHESNEPDPVIITAATVSAPPTTTAPPIIVLSAAPRSSAVASPPIKKKAR